MAWRSEPRTLTGKLDRPARWATNYHVCCRDFSSQREDVAFIIGWGILVVFIDVSK
jgi:hypothetical protein